MRPRRIPISHVDGARFYALCGWLLRSAGRPAGEPPPPVEVSPLT
jgi:hypothetical protein